MNRWVVRIVGLFLILALLLVLNAMQNQLKQLAASRQPAPAPATHS
jgi:uncharacterized integral membrane protein